MQPTQWVPDGVRCLHCHYELRQLDVKGRCPECGSSIGQALRAIRWYDYDDLRRRVARGCILLTASQILMIFGIVGFRFGDRQVEWIYNFWSGSGWTMVICSTCSAIVATTAVWTLTRSPLHMSVPHLLARTLPIAWTVASAAVASITILMVVQWLGRLPARPFLLLPLAAVTLLPMGAALLGCHLLMLLSPLMSKRWRAGVIAAFVLMTSGLAAATAMIFIEYLDWTHGLGLYLGFSNAWVAEIVPKAGLIAAVIAGVMIGSLLLNAAIRLHRM